MQDTSFIIFILIALAVLFLASKMRSKFKSPNVGALCLVNGGVKTGKSTFSVNLAKREIRARLRRFKLKRAIRKILFLDVSKMEEPKLYSNIPLVIKGVDTHEVTLKHFSREERFNYGSVVYLSEFSLIADSRLVSDAEINEKLLEFFKLFGHETKGGVCIVDTQSILDCHYSLKRCIDRHLYIYKCVKWLPFFLILKVREERYAEDGTVVNSYNEDMEETLKTVIIPKSVWKNFDCYCYSLMTDDKPIKNKPWSRATLKVNNYVSFKQLKDLASNRKAFILPELRAKYRGFNNEK